MEQPLVPCQAPEGSLSPRWIRPGAFCPSGKALRWQQVEGESGLGISWEA